MPNCDRCGRAFYSGDGIWGDDDNICGECLADDIEESEKRNPPKPVPEPGPKK